MTLPTLNDFRREFEALAAIRDELGLKAHVARKDGEDELARLEAKWLLVEEELQPARAHAKADANVIGKSARALLVDLKQGTRASSAG